MSELFRHNDIDVRNLTVENPKQEKPVIFDPERDIPAAYWKVLEDNLRANHEAKYWQDFLPNASQFAILAPTKARPFLDDEVRGNLQAYIETSRNLFDYANFLLLFPETRSTLAQVDELYDFGKDTLERIRSRTDLANYLSRLYQLKVLSPDRFLEIYPDTDEHWLRIVHATETSTDVDSVVTNTAQLKQIDPIRGRKMSLSPEGWQQAKAVLSQAPASRASTNSTHFAFPANLKIIASETTIIDTDGVHITMPKTPDRPDSPAIPEQRKY